MDSASTLVIGGGIAGISLVYHLARQGEKNVLLLEKNELTAGSTWHAAGLTTNFHSSMNLKKIHYYSVNLYAKICREVGQVNEMRLPGSVRTASTPQAADGLKFQMAKAGIQQAPQMLLTPEEVKEKMPLIDSNKILMGLYTPNDGYVDPYSLTQALAKGAKKFGAKIVQQCEVTSMNLKENGEWVVGTPHGEITAERVVNAAGLWAKELGRMAGLDLPLVPLENQYVVTASVPEVQALKENFPVIRMMEPSCYLRKERDGFLFGTFESEQHSKVLEGWQRDGVPKDFGKELLPGDLDRILPYMEQVMEIIPAVGSAKIQTVVNGPTAYTPDSFPLVGPSCIPNMWLDTGFCSFGIIGGGGMGKFLADWIQNGEPMQELTECDPGRFGEWATDDFASAKARKTHGMSYATHFPHEEKFAGCPSPRVTPLYGRQRQRGAAMAFCCGWETPRWFAGPGMKPEYRPSFRRPNWHSEVKREWKMVTESAGVIDLSPYGKFIIHGEQSTAFVDRIASNKVPSVGRTVISHLLTPRGKVCAEVTITQTCPGRFLVVTGPESEIHDLRWISEIARKEKWDVRLENVSDTLGCLSVAGPKSKEILSALHQRFKESFPIFTAEKLNIKGMGVQVVRQTYTGELGWELYVPMEDIGKLYDSILEVGEESGLGDFGTYTLDVLRMEKGFRRWGREMNHETTPIEAGLMEFVDMSKEDFIGKNAVENDIKELPKRELVLIKLPLNVEFDPVGDESIWVGNKVVGHTTSGCFSHHLGRPLAFSYLPPFLTTPRISFHVEMMNEKHKAEVLPGPPVLTYEEKLKRQK